LSAVIFQKIGPIYLTWTEIPDDKGKLYILDEPRDFLIWVQWKKSYSESSKLDWSAEPQSMLIESGLEEEVQKVLKSKIAWPYPTENDGPGWDIREKIAKKEKYTLWTGNQEQERKQWDIRDRK